VGSFKPNSFGLYDTAANVWEWAEDCYHANYNGAPEDGSAWKETGKGDCLRVIRGGSLTNHPDFLRTSFRFENLANLGHYTIGFRLAQDLD
jgi:formylglycine-generating enzyme required for sulfatase activity